MSQCEPFVRQEIRKGCQYLDERHTQPPAETNVSGLEYALYVGSDTCERIINCPDISQSANGTTGDSIMISQCGLVRFLI